jgi:glycosyltransferase involved in cell wall biosynthesis
MRTAAVKNNRISLCMIVRNEAANLSRCLASVDEVVDEIVVVDTGSTDGTKEVARRFGSRVFDFPWRDDFAAARNFGLEQATGDWVLVLDADEYLEESGAVMLAELTGRPGAADVYLLPIKSLMAPELDEWLTSLVLRLFRNSPDLRFRGKIHEQLMVPEGKRAETAEQGPWIIHLGYMADNRALKKDRNLRMLEKALAEEPENPFYHYYLSTEYILRGDYEKALAHVRPALAGIPADILLFRVAAVRNAVICLLKKGEWAAAEKLMLAEIAVFSDFPDFHFCLGEVCREKGDYVRAIESYDKALAIEDPPLVGCGLSGSKGYRSLFHRGLCQEKLRRYFEAIESYRAAMADNPSFDIPLANLIKGYLYIGTGEECLRYLADHFDIGTPGLKLLAARLLFAGGCPEAARGYAGQTGDVETGYEKSMLLGEIALAGGNPGEAADYFRTVPAGTAQYTLALVFRCICAWMQGKPAAGKTIAELAGIGPNRPAADFLGYLNQAFSGRAAAPLPVENEANTETCLQFGRQLHIKLLELKMFRPAEITGNRLLALQPELRRELAYTCRKLGAPALADRLMGRAGGPRHYLELAGIYENLAAEFLERVPVLPEAPLTNSVD